MRDCVLIRALDEGNVAALGCAGEGLVEGSEREGGLLRKMKVCSIVDSQVL